MTTAVRSPRCARGGPAKLPFRLVCAQSLDEVDRLAGGWRGLDSRGGCPASQLGWTRAALRAFADDGAGQLLGVARGEQLLAVAPLVCERRHGVRRAVPPGATRLGEPVDFAWSDTAALARLAAAIARGGSPLVLPRVRDDSPALPALARVCRGRAIVVVRPAAGYPFLRLHDGWAEPERQLSADGRDALRGALRAAERRGHLATEIHTPGLNDLAGLLDTALEVAQSGREVNQDVFLRQYAEAACVEGTLRVALLRIGDRVAAAQIGVESAAAFWLLTAGERPGFADCAPGRLLMRETIRYAALAALDSFEFWGRTAAASKEWTTSERACVSLRTYPLNPRGLAALVADIAVAGWRHRKGR